MLRCSLTNERGKQCETIILRGKNVFGNLISHTQLLKTMGVYFGGLVCFCGFLASFLNQDRYFVTKTQSFSTTIHL